MDYVRRSMLHPCAHSVRRRALLVLSLATLPFLPLLASGCAKPEPPRLTPKVVRVAGASASGLDLDVELEVHNPNSFPLLANSVSGTLIVGRGQRLGSGSATLKESIRGGATSPVESRVHIAWADIAAIAPLLLRERVPYEFRGDVTLGGGGIDVALPFSLSGELTRAELLQAGLRGL